MLFTLKWLSAIFPESKGAVTEPVIIENVVADSRLAMKNALFVPIVGEKFDGHQFIRQAIENGAVAALWDKAKKMPETLPEQFPVFLVDDTLASLQELALHYRDEIDPLVIGITGSNGKTTTKDLVAAVVQANFRTHYTAGNLNNHIGLPLTVLSMNRNTEVLVLEMGMNQFGEIETLSKIAKPDYAIITNIGESHIEFLGSREGIAKAKLEITAGMNDSGKLIIDGDEPLLEHIHASSNIITCGYGPNNDYVIEHVEVLQDRTKFRLSEDFEFTIPLIGKHHALNAAFAIAIGKHLKMDPAKINQAFSTLHLTGMRFEMIKGPSGVSIINDAYNASPTSMKASIEAVKNMAGYRDKVLVLGDMFELGQHSETMHRSVAKFIDSHISALFTYGEAAEKISMALKEQNKDIKSAHFHSTADLINELQTYFNEDTMILFKASRGMKFEKIVEKVLDRK